MRSGPRKSDVGKRVPSIATANREINRYLVSMRGIILQPPTVTTSRMQSTVWADAAWCQTARQNPPAGFTSLNALNGNIAPGRPVFLRTHNYPS